MRFLLKVIINAPVGTFFSRVVGIPTDGIPAPLFYLCGLLAWNYFAQNIAMGATTFTGKSGGVSKTLLPISRMIPFPFGGPAFRRPLCYEPESTLASGPPARA